MSGEEWRPVPGAPHYEASSLGRIRSLDRYLPQMGRDNLRLHRGKVLSPGPVGKDYPYLGLTIRPLPGKQKVHRLVAMAFLGLDPKSDLEVDHLNDDKTDNRLDNLEVVTHAENMRRMSERKTHCSNGHELTPENTYIDPAGHKRCRVCMRENDRNRNGERNRRRTERRRNDPAYAAAQRIRRRAAYANRKQEEAQSS